MKEIKITEKLNTELMDRHPNNHERRRYMNYLREKYLTKELFEYIFEKEKMSMSDAVRYIHESGLKFSRDYITFVARSYNIQLPTCSEGFKRSNLKRQKTNLDRFGAANPLTKGTTSYDKRNNTVMDRYGVTSVFKLESTKNKSKETLFKKYGVYSPADLPQHKISGEMTKPHRIVSNFLKEIGCDHVNEPRGKFRKFNEMKGNFYSPRPDISIEDLKIVIEIYGDKWHANPNLYKKNDILYLNWRSDKEMKVSEVWELDKNRKEHIESFGYRMIVLWESDINNDSYKEILLNELKYRI